MTRRRFSRRGRRGQVARRPDIKWIDPTTATVSDQVASVSAKTKWLFWQSITRGFYKQQVLIGSSGASAAVLGRFRITNLRTTIHVYSGVSASLTSASFLHVIAAGIRISKVNTTVGGVPAFTFESWDPSNIDHASMDDWLARKDVATHQPLPYISVANTASTTAPTGLRIILSVPVVEVGETEALTLSIANDLASDIGALIYVTSQTTYRTQRIF